MIKILKFNLNFKYFSKSLELVKTKRKFNKFQIQSNNKNLSNPNFLPNLPNKNFPLNLIKKATTNHLLWNNFLKIFKRSEN
jgi:hypothetical protein